MALTKEKIFTFDTVREQAEALFDESGETDAASATYANGMITLTTCRIRDCDVKVYHLKESDEIYAKMDEAYLQILENITSGSDFWDMWNAIINTIIDFLIVDEVYNP